MTPRTKVYTLKEVAEILRLNPQTLYNNVRRGTLHFPKVGKAYRVTEAQLQDLIEHGYGRQRN